MGVASRWWRQAGKPFLKAQALLLEAEPGGSFLEEKESKALVLLNGPKGVALPSHESCVVFYFELYALPLRLHFNVRRLISFGSQTDFVLCHMIA